MTGGQSRLLKVGDRVRWGATTTDLGTVVETTWTVSPLIGMTATGLQFSTTTWRMYWPPFRNFGEHFYTYQILLDLKVEKGMAIRTEPHPRFYTDRTDTAPTPCRSRCRR
jgi:hypothetical protein